MNNTNNPLKKIWARTLHGLPGDAALDQSVLDILGLGLLPTYQYLYTHQPDFEQFENWVAAHFNGVIPADKLQQCIALMNGSVTQQHIPGEAVLTTADLLFWEEHGYVIVKNAISTADAALTRNAVYDFLGMDEAEPATWYQPTEKLQGIMVTLYDDEMIKHNRNASRIRIAFQQLWQERTLIAAADKCGFNPPETEQVNYRGIGLHWDVSLVPPVPFGTQGILYLSDTAAHQGALTVVPGFHRKLDEWLKALPATTDPRNVDLSVYHPMPIAAAAGDLVIWDQRLPHSGSPNTANYPRVVQYINWYSPNRKVQEEWR